MARSLRRGKETIRPQYADHLQKALINLEKDGFIERSDDDTLIPTETGKIMSSSMICMSLNN